MRILIAFDGSESPNEAVFDLARAGMPADTQVCVLSVRDPRAHRASSEEGEYHARRSGGSGMLAHGPLVHSLPQDACRAAEEGTI